MQIELTLSQPGVGGGGGGGEEGEVDACFRKAPFGSFHAKADLNVVLLFSQVKI